MIALQNEVVHYSKIRPVKSATLSDFMPAFGIVGVMLVSAGAWYALFHYVV